MDLFSKLKAVVPHMWLQNGRGDNPAPEGNNISFELPKPPKRTSSFRNLLKKRFVNQKASSVAVMEDPRSPSVAFQRSPILRKDEMPMNLSFQSDASFDVDDMLETVQQRLLISTPRKAPVAQDISIQIEESPQDENEVEMQSPFPSDENIIGTIEADWADFEFMTHDNSIPESLLVETSRMDSSIGEDGSSVDKPDQYSAESESSSKNSQDERSQISVNFDCKVVGFIEKQTAEEAEDSGSLSSTTPETSTPTRTIAQIVKTKRLEAKRAALTPLRSLVANSPAPAKNLKTSTPSNSKFYVNSKEDAEEVQKDLVGGNKKKKINSQTSRRLPKAPSTPLTPLFKTQRARLLPVMNDQENV